MQFLKIMAFCVLAALLYGVVHDQVIARICVEYFSTFRTQSPTMLGLGWGILATWWVGAFLGVLLAIAARAGSRPKLRMPVLLNPVLKLFAVMALSALLAGLAAYLLARSGPDWVLASLTRSTPARFVAAWCAHGASYGVGLVRGIFICVAQYRKRGSPVRFDNLPQFR
ncbi:MAG TPA: hypothetical protein VEJ45_12015 [Candidatus Acidoferrales bacterium]|nr:hypothetical protein [Candidatus Acidoferrales bacterium]